MASIILDFIAALLKRGRPRKAVHDFAAMRGFGYSEQIDPAGLDLNATSFFGPFDVARDAITGTVGQTPFTYFNHDRASGRGESALVRSVVAFELVQETKDCGPTHASDHWMFEKAGAHIFLWRWTEKNPRSIDDIDWFLETALQVFHRL